MIYKILAVDDDSDFLQLLTTSLRSAEVSFFTADTTKEAIALAQKQEFDLVFLDVKLPDGLGVDLFTPIKSLHPDVPIIMVSGESDAKIIVQAIKDGASDYVKKPVDFKNLRGKVNDLLAMREATATKNELDAPGAGQIVGKNFRTKQLVREVSRIAHSDAPVLLRGESGTGKTLVAEIIHAHSSRNAKPFVTINCPAIPVNLLESELFGHEKGAFTGAIKEKIGKFELASGGTIFLDEIGDLSFELQSKILRVLQGKEFERVGGLKTIRADVRIIAATNRNLEEAIQNRQFREDLYYRLNVLPVHVPSLRERKEDIQLLANHFMRTYAAKADKVLAPLSEDVMRHLTNYDWPGNIRELQNVIERAVVLSRGTLLRPSDLMLQAQPVLLTKNPSSLATPQSDAISSLKELEYRALMRALTEEGGSVSRAAKMLGIGRNTLYRRLKKYNVALKKFAE